MTASLSFQKIIAITACIICMGMQAMAQAKVLDSLLSGLRHHTINDTTKVALYGKIAQAYAKAHDYKNALQYGNNYYYYRDSIANAAITLKMQQLQTDNDQQKKQNQADVLEKNRALKQRHMIWNVAVVWFVLSGIGLLAIFLLLSRSKRLEKQSSEIIARQAVKLDELNKFKDKLFSVLSHDLHGPLSSLSATLSMLDDQLITPHEFTELKPVVARQLSSLTLLLDNLLKWAKNSMIGGEPRQERVSIHRIAEQNINLLRYVADKKQITIQNNIPKETIAKGDPGQLDIVIRNLISNAVKFTNISGTITLTAIKYAHTIEISVHDTGVGMTTEQMDKLFRALPNISTSGTGGEKGIGLGLLLCYEFVKANHGNISVSSVEGKGSTFTVVLPGV